MKKDIGFWNAQGEYIEDIQEIDEMELKEYKISDYLKDKDGLAELTIEELIKENVSLEQENARLKEEAQLDGECIDKLIEVKDIYKQALEEIRGILDKSCKQCKNEYLSEDYCSGQGDCYAIKQVIDEVLQ